MADIGIPASLYRGLGLAAWSCSRRATRPTRLPGRGLRARTRATFGHVLVLAGSLGKTGAAVLAATARAPRGRGPRHGRRRPRAALALAAGAPARGDDGAAAPRPRAAPSARARSTRALALAESRDVVVLGPGLGQEAGTREFVRELVARCPRPIVVDADGLNALGAVGDAPAANPPSVATHPTVLTPHPGEMARLLGTTHRRGAAAAAGDGARALSLRTGAVSS